MLIPVSPARGGGLLDPHLVDQKAQVGLDEQVADPAADKLLLDVQPVRDDGSIIDKPAIDAGPRVRWPGRGL